MSTSTESAQTWINEKNPGKAEIQTVIDKLEARIESWQGDDDKIQGSIDAVVYLHSHLESLDVPDVSAQANEAKLDTSELIPEAKPIELEHQVKQATFEALKAQLGKSLNKP